MTTRIRFAEAEGLRIAYQVTGRGAFHLLLLPGMPGHLELDWEWDGAARWYERLGSFARLIRFDRRGTGLSERGTDAPTVEAYVADALAVLDAAGADTAAVLGQDAGATTALALAVAEGTRVSALVLLHATARPAGLSAGLEEAEEVRTRWGVDIELAGSGLPGGEELHRWIVARARASASPGLVEKLVLLQSQVDVRPLLEGIDVPTLVLDRVPAENGHARELAERIRGARFVSLTGPTWVPFVEPDVLADEVETFLTGMRPVAASTQALGTYRLGQELGRGGMGVVYLAYDERLERRVALKVLAAELADDAIYRERFLREQRLAASIEHPNVVPIYDAGEAGGRLFLAMRHVRGTDLLRLIEAEAPLEPVRALRIVSDVAGALDAAHAHGLVHRDVKPANVLLDGSGHCYLCDFGLTRATARDGRLTATGQLVGTLEYLAPESIRAEDVDGRADVYALGCIFYECLTGVPPFRRATEAQTLWAHMQEEPAPLTSLRSELPRALDDVLGRVLAKEPAERYANGAELVAAAGTALGLETPVVRLQRRRRGRRLLLAGAVLLALATVLLVLELLRGGLTGAPAPGSGRPVAQAFRANRTSGVAFDARCEANRLG